MIANLLYFKYKYKIYCNYCIRMSKILFKFELLVNCSDYWISLSKDLSFKTVI